MGTGTAWIGAITIDCDDAEVMRRFYRDALGGEDIPDLPHSVRVGGSHHIRSRMTPGLIVFCDPAGHPFCLFEDPDGTPT